MGDQKLVSSISLELSAGTETGIKPRTFSLRYALERCAIGRALEFPFMLNRIRPCNTHTHTHGVHLGLNEGGGNYLNCSVSHKPPDNFLNRPIFAVNASLRLYCNMSHVRTALSTHVASSSPQQGLQGGSGISPKGTGLSRRNSSSHTCLICHMQMFPINTPGDGLFAGTFSLHQRLF